jgi:hypothetical protein
MFVVQYGASPEVPADPVKGHACVVWNRWRFVHGAELYDVNADRAQQHDLAAQQPEVLAKMSAYYDQWWAGLEPVLGKFVTLTIGADAENPVLLSSSDWQDVYADNSNHIRNAAGGPRGGPWNLQVERDGDYEITLRRWPFDTDGALAGNITPPGKALPISRAKLTIAGLERESSTGPEEREAKFTLPLKAGRTQLQAWFQDADGHDLCGAFYARVRRVENRP